VTVDAENLHVACEGKSELWVEEQEQLKKKGKKEGYHKMIYRGKCFLVCS
jgi:hypothetical protein